MRDRMKRALTGACSSAARSVAGVIPKKGNLVLFGARKGNWYADCSRRVYEEMLAVRPDLDPVWMSRDKHLLKRLKGEGLPVCSMNTPRGVLLIWRASMAVISTQLYDIARFPSMVPDSLRLVFLGHGKSAKASTLAFRSGRSDGFRRMFERTERLTEVAISTSPFISKLAAQANGFPEDRFQVTGYPRNDDLVRPDRRLRDRWDAYVGDMEPAMTVLYAPTWRQRGQRTRFFPFQDFDRNKLGQHLAENSILLLLRPHERDLLNHPDLRRFLRELADSSPWIRMCDQRTFQNVNHLLPFTDVLVTDYSSICNDYLLLDRPMVFIPYDYEEFEKVQGFMYDYFRTLPGPAVYTQQGFLSALQDVRSGTDPFVAKRRALRDKVHVHTDGRSTKRVMEIIARRLERPVGAISGGVVHAAQTVEGATEATEATTTATEGGAS